MYALGTGMHASAAGRAEQHAAHPIVGACAPRATAQPRGGMCRTAASPAVLRPHWHAPSVHSVHLRFVNHERCITTHSANASAGLSHGVGRLPLALGH